MEPIKLDGSQGEGGGQILRSALSLSLLTGRPFVIEKIRAGRAKPGLLRQHLTAVNAAQAIGDAQVEGASMGSLNLQFTPRAVLHGDRTFSIGTAGSVVLVLQTVLPPLLVKPGKSQLVIEGGTHNPLAPPWPFLEEVFLPILVNMGAKVKGRMERAGFMPAGGGRVHLEIEGVPALRPLELLERGALSARSARAIVSNLSRSIAERELKELAARLGLSPGELRAEVLPSSGPGNALCLELVFERGRELITAIGEKSLASEAVAAQVAAEAARFLAAVVPVGEHLADQLLLPLAIAGGGSFRTLAPTPHARTNASVIERFLPVSVAFEDRGAGAWQVEVRAARAAQ